MTMRQDCEAIIKQLESCGIKEWAEVWVNHRIRFHRAYCMGYIFSTLHGTEFFSTVIKCLDGATWESTNDGEYEENFRKFIKHYRKQL